MSFKSIVEMFKYDSSEQPFVEEAMRLEKADEIMSEIEARTQALQERLVKHGTHDQEDHGGKDERRNPKPEKQAPERRNPKPMPTTPARPKKPKPEMQAPERRNSEQEALDRIKQELEEKKKKDEAARRKIEEQMGRKA
jgi:hypothetical protein